MKWKDLLFFNKTFQLVKVNFSNLTATEFHLQVLGSSLYHLSIAWQLHNRVFLWQRSLIVITHFYCLIIISFKNILSSYEMSSKFLFITSWTFALNLLKSNWYILSNISLIPLSFTWSCTSKWWLWILLVPTLFRTIWLQLTVPAFPDVHLIGPTIHQPKIVCRTYWPPSSLEITLIDSKAWM